VSSVVWCGLSTDKLACWLGHVHAFTVLNAWVQVALRKVPGIKDVVCTKWLSLLWCVDDGACDGDDKMAFDSRMQGIPLEVPPGCDRAVASQAYGFPPWVDFSKLSRSFLKLGRGHVGCEDVLDGLATIARTINAQRRERLKNRFNPVRSKIATWLQEERLANLVEQFCRHAQCEANMSSTLGLRESLRFLYELRGVHAWCYDKQRAASKGVRLYEIHPKMYRDDHGNVFSEMCPMLQPGDVAQWWDHPGLLVWLRDAPRCHASMSVESKSTGWARSQAYQSAASFSRNMEDLVERMVNRSVFTIYWSWDVNVAEPWGFNVRKLTAEDCKSLRK
jgi:hypothetical protein